MKHFVKILSIFLVLVLLVNMLPMSIFAEQLQDDVVAELSPAKPDASVNILHEITQKRTQYTKEFLLSNGLYLAVAYPEPVHYEKDGVWEAIDNTLTAKTDGTYINTAGRWQVAFPQQFGKNQSVTVTKDGYTLSFGMPQRLTNADAALMSASADSVAEIQAESSTAQIQATIDVTAEKETAEYPETVVEKLASRLTYESIHSGTDVIYDLTGEKVKESVVMKSYDSTLRGYRYTLNVGSMIPVLADEGHITFYDETQTNVVMVMPAPYMVDAAMEMSMDVGVSLTGSGSVYTLTYTLPTDWLASGDRQWPVILDPVVQASTSVENICDAIVASNHTYSYTVGYLDVGYESTTGIKRTYVKYSELPELGAADMVVAASMTMWQMYNRSTSVPVEVHKVLGGWESSTITWSNKPSYDASVEDFVITSSARKCTWDVTDIVREWYTTGVNTGMLFKTPDSVENGGTDDYRQFYSSDYGVAYRPALTIMFRNSNGLESYWDYTSSSAGRAGTGYVNNYTGNLVWTHSDIGFPGNRMPVSINHIYNVNDAAEDLFGMGYGWRTNYNQRVYPWSANSNYYVWEDSDGTKHYFLYESSGVYKDEDGLELTLTDTGSGSSTYVITDKYGNTSHFNEFGYLSKLQNNQATKSAITITYKTAYPHLIDIITDGAGRKYHFTYIDYLLDRISFKGTGSTELTYTTYTYTSSDLTKITDKDGKYATYAYNSGHILSSATDVDGYKLSYTYTLSSGTFAPCRVASVREYDGSVSGGHLTFAYANNQTTVSDQINGTKLIYQFNNWGNTVSVQDDEGRAQFMEFDRDVWNDNTGKGNQLNLSSKLQATVVNLLYDSSFEIGVSWTPLTVSPSMSYGITGNAAYMGQKSLHVSGCSGEILRSAAFTVAPGETYTFSACLRTTTGNGQIGIMNAADSTDVKYTDQINTSGAWSRLEISYTNTSASSKQMYAIFRGMLNATAYIDCVQLEKSATASRYNLVQNGDFRSGNSGWYGIDLETGDGVATPENTPAAIMGGQSYKINANHTAAKYIYHTIPVYGPAGDSFVFSGWASGGSASTANQYGEISKVLALKFNIFYTDGTNSSKTVSFNPDVDDWQYAAGAIIADKAYKYITMEALSFRNANTVYFDGLQAYRENYGTTYTYDDKGNVKSVKDLQKKVTTYEYDTSNNLTKILENNAAKMTYTYDSYHNVKTATSQEGVKYAFEYDTYGNNTKVSITNGTSTISTSAAYTSNGNLLASTTDALDNKTTYSYNDNTGLVTSVKYPRDTATTQTNYTYDSMYRTATAACTNSTGQAMSASYGYTDDNLTSVSSETTRYTFTYGNFSLRSSVKIGSRTLASYSYTSGNNRLNKLTYGNGDYIQYTYDAQGRVTKQTYEDGTTVEYQYDRNGRLARTVDSASGISTTYLYDSSGRLISCRDIGQRHDIYYYYDTSNNITQVREVTSSGAKTTTYTYDDDNRVISMTADGITVEYTYDSLGRLTKQVTKNGRTVISTKNTTYATSPSGKATAQVRSYNGYTYTYDDNGNIISVTDGTNTTSYVYDSQNQLIRENNQALGKTWRYVYDDGGNRLQAFEYNYTTGDISQSTAPDFYNYLDSDWGDLLTAQGSLCQYDEIGNLVSDGTWTYTWKHGRQLASMSKGSTTWTYTYDANGMRTSRGNGTTTYNYIYNGDKLTHMTKGSTKLTFTYDASGTPLTVTYNGTKYYYNTNLQGDVIGILDSSGTTVVTYIYDAWGRIRSTTGSLASTLGADNPIRYRGYVYDTETGLYYVSSRYYDPEIGRFINADAVDLLGANGDFDSLNLFAYCGNNPVSREDPSGGLWVTAGLMAVGGLIGAAISAVSSAVTQQALTGTVNWKSVGVAAASGFVSGAVAASPLGIVGQQIAGGVIGGLSYAADCYVNDKAMKLDEAILSVGMGVVSGRIGGSGANEKMVLSNAAKSAKQTIARESRRANQQYAQKVIAATISSRNNTFASTAWVASFRFAAGTGISNGATGKYSSLELFPNAPTWKPW